MICLIAMVVFAILGIFSAKYRAFAKEAFSCVFRRVTLRKCNTAFDQKMKAKISARLMKRSEKAGKLVFRHFDAISWVFTILMIVSFLLVANSVYNLAVYGSCDPHSTECIFNPEADLTCGSEYCLENGCDCETVGCDAPVFAACKGDCDCQENVCG